MGSILTERNRMEDEEMNVASMMANRELPGDPEPRQGQAKAPDMVNHPPHYNEHPTGIECIDVTEWMSFNLGNAVKYIWRADLKGNADQDIEKAIWFLKRELERRRSIAEKTTNIRDRRPEGER